MHIVAREKIDAIEGVTGDEALDFVERSERIEGAEPGFEPVGFKPDGVTVGLASLCAARLAKIAGRAALAEGNERADASTPIPPARRTSISRKSGLTPARSAGFANDLNVAKGIGHGTRFFVQAGGGKNNIGERRGLGEEEILND